MNTQSINTSIFKKYDIRGIYPSQINEDLAYLIGKSFVQLIQNELNNKQPKIGVSNDMRISSPQIKGSVIKGMIEQGAIVYDLGFNSTPSFYFGISYNNLDAGIQVSASHNPKEYNGLKLVRKNAKPISYDTGISQIKDTILNNSFNDPIYKGIYRFINNNTPNTFKELLSNFDLNSIRQFKILVDGSNSMGILDIEELFKYINQVELIKVNFELDGNLPVHNADPLTESNLKQAQEEVVKYNADLGLVPDGDGDRYFFIDNKGNIIRQEIIRGIMAQIELKKDPSAIVCYDIRPGKITEDMINELNGKYIVTKVGHSLIKQTMIENNAVFGGESSGHYFYKTKYGTFENIPLLLVKFLTFLSEQNRPLDEIIKPYQKYFNSGEINSKVLDINKKIDEIKNKYTDGELNELDGITITYKDFWFNVRPSNTEPVLRLTLEATSKEIMEQKTKEVLDLIRS